MSKNCISGILPVFTLVLAFAGAMPAGEPIFVPIKIDGPVHDPANGSFWYGPFAESASVIDVNNDGRPDISAGRNWYEGPNFTVKHKDFFEGAEKWNPVWGHFREIALDVNKDGRMDIVNTCYQTTTMGLWWQENPGDPTKKWPVHILEPPGPLEGPELYDLDGDGDLDILINYFDPKGGVTWYESIDKEPWLVKHVIGAEGNDHGNGAGDINGDGRLDIVTRHGWWEAPKNPRDDRAWRFHNDWDLNYTASHPMLVYDVNGDGLADIIVGNAHGYGLFWYEQKIENGRRRFVEHTIESDYGPFHTMVLADVNGDGKPDLVTGRRLFAHDGNDEGDHDPLFIFWYDIKGGKFERHVVSFGNLQWYPDRKGINTPPQVAIGTGMKISVADINLDGKVDILVSGRSGLYLFLNQGFAPRPKKDHPYAPLIGIRLEGHKKYEYPQ